MKIELSEYDGERMGIYESSIVKKIKKISEKEFSIVFGEYELLFIPENNSDIKFLKNIFYGEFSLETNPRIRILLKKKNFLFRKGIYEVSEFIEEGGKKGTLEIHVATGPSEEFRIYIIPESHENIPKIFDKIFN
jgi:hypothetical protein